MRNTDKLYYPFVESILSVLPIVDEFVIALGKGDSDDKTELLINALASDKIRIIHTEWNTDLYTNGTEFAHQTDIAKSHCSGDWLFYLQSDELLHEKFFDVVKNYCHHHLSDPEVEGFLFTYKHFFGDYEHYIVSHTWYPKEIRIVRNIPQIHSWGDAQSFRYIENFNGKDYRTRKGTRSLNVVEIPAEIYHYGWVRPPQLMQTKSREMNFAYHDRKKIEKEYDAKPAHFDYGSLAGLHIFKETHPRVLKEFMDKFNWRDLLHYENDYKVSRQPMKHEKLKYRILTFIENNFLGERKIFGYRNWKILSSKRLT